ncbi:helix-turn-helix transcriptional regulator [Leucobacter manosquensis]|uniref:Helix-turn-helix domain-containing protein n=1 Tax=Leucobacter manosquensis TaxID=2810611 RepID=A0ABS5M7X6_9MICO|nr:helix-turn-helix domain-containing protein [Leucobacter manosquensis]MBS3183291.1 helix-turn-helix domain-containing protein [Leucobacter manosquensis]
MTEWMTPDELAELTGLSQKTLANLRSEYRRFPFYRIEGSRAPLYKREEIDAIIEASRIEVRP